jgi:hypothetical protein
MQRRNACHFLHQYSATWQLDKKVLFVTQKAVTGHSVGKSPQWDRWRLSEPFGTIRTATHFRAVRIVVRGVQPIGELRFAVSEKPRFYRQIAVKSVAAEMELSQAGVPLTCLGFSSRKYRENKSP